jgi:hypothetical protein
MKQANAFWFDEKHKIDTTMLVKGQHNPYAEVCTDNQNNIYLEAQSVLINTWF